MRQLANQFDGTHPTLTTARIAILRKAFRFCGVCTLLIGLVYLQTDVISAIDARPFRPALVLLFGALMMVIPVNHLWLTWPVALMPMVSGLTAAMELGLMYVFIGMLLTSIGIAIWQGTLRSILTNTAIALLIGGLVYSGHISASADAIYRLPMAWLVGIALALCIGLVIRAFDEALHAGDRALADSNQAKAVAETALVRAVAAEHELTERGDKQKQIFATIGHELRTPAAALRLLANEDLSNASHAAMVLRQSTQLLSVLDDMREIVDPNYVSPVRTAPVQLQALARDIHHSCAAVLAHAGMTLNWHFYFARPELSQQAVITDISRVTKILVNLLRNACFHADGSELEIAISQTQFQLRLTCTDNGRGWPKDGSRDSLLEPWRRHQSSGAGLGLGLSIIHRSADELGGSLRLFDSSLGGAGLEVVLPLTGTAAALVDWKDSPVLPLIKPWSLLIVDDHDAIRSLTQHQLGRLFTTTDTAKSGAEALEKVAAHRPDVIISDHFMPGLSGDQLVAQLRAGGYDGVIIGSTGATLFEGIHPMITAGADFLAPKPVLPSTLVDLIAPVIDGDAQRAWQRQVVGAETEN